MNTENPNITVVSTNRLAAIRALAVVGFIALIFLGMTLAIYTARYVPSAVSSLGQAAVSLSSVFVPANKPVLQVVDTGTQLPFGTPAITATTTSTDVAATTTTTVTTTTTDTPPATTYPVVPTAGTETTTAYPVAGTGSNTSTQITNTAPLYGLPDLAVTSVVTGYLPANSSSINDFVPSDTVPANTSFAVKFTVANVGTNATGQWDFSANLPTSQYYTFFSPEQQSMNPGDHTDFMLHLDVGQALHGTNQAITISLDPNKTTLEGNESNNVTNATVNIN